MNASQLLCRQLSAVNDILHDLAGDLTPAEWQAQPIPGQNTVGFTAWHVAATTDWAIHTFLRGIPRLAEEEPWRSRILNTCWIPFGMLPDEADAVAAATTPTDVLAYADEVLVAGTGWVSSLSDADLDVVSNDRAHIQTRMAYRLDAYLKEIEDMFSQPRWRVLAGACSGHCRMHLGELELMKRALRGGAPPAT